MYERDLGSMSGVVTDTADSVYQVVKTYFADLKLQLLVNADAVDPPPPGLPATRGPVFGHAFRPQRSASVSIQQVVPTRSGAAGAAQDRFFAT